MPSNNIYTAVDLGSSKIRTLVATVEPQSSRLNVIGVGSSASNGIRRGMVIDLEEAIANIVASIEDAERMSGESIHRVAVGISGSHIETYDTKGVIAINGRNAEITDDDVDRVLEAARTVHLPSNRDILRIIPRNFSVDSQKQVKYPVGMTGIRLEVEAHIMTGQSSIMKNLDKCLRETGVDVQEVVPSLISCAEATLDRRQKELGVAVIEVGSACTNLVVFEEGTIIHSVVIPAGGDHVTNDLAIGLRCSIDTAEKIKIEYGGCNSKDISDTGEIDLAQLSRVDTHKASRKQISSIMEARYHEIFLLVRDELARIGRAGMLPGGVVLCGGGVKATGLIDLAREVLQLPCQTASPVGFDGITERIDDPSFIHVAGLLQFMQRYGQSSSWFSPQLFRHWGAIRQWAKRFFPA